MVKTVYAGIFYERLHRGTRNRNCYLYHRGEDDCPSGGKEVWGEKEHDTYRCNKRGVFVKVVYEVR